MSERIHEPGCNESHQTDFESAAAEYIEASERLIAEISKLSLADTIRLLRKEEEDTVSGFAGSKGVFGRIAAVHFPGVDSAGAFNMLMTMGLRFIEDDELDSEVPKAKAWIYRDFDDTFGLMSNQQDTTESLPQLTERVVRRTRSE